MRILGYFLLMALTGCHPRPDAGSCDEIVEVIDFSQLDGCGYLLVDKSGTKMLAANANEFELSRFARVQISYHELTDMASICMSEDKMIEITCFSVDNSIPRKLPCLEYTGINEGGWLETVAQELEPTQILRYKYLDGFIYFCKKQSTTRMYDCQGTLLCTMTPTQACQKYTRSLTDEVVIWNSHR